MNLVRVCNRSVLLTFLATMMVGCGEKHPKPVALPPPPVQVALPVEQTVTDYQTFTARTQAVESANLNARVTGYLEKILFKDGEMVKEGDVLFQIDDRPYKAALDQAKANLESAKASLDVAKSSLEIAKASLVKNQADYDMDMQLYKLNNGAVSMKQVESRLGARDEAKGAVNKANCLDRRSQRRNPTGRGWRGNSAAQL